MTGLPETGSRKSGGAKALPQPPLDEPVGRTCASALFKEALNKSACADLRQKLCLRKREHAGIPTDFKVS